MTRAKNNKINFTKTTLSNLMLPEKNKIKYFYDIQGNGLGIMVFESGAKTFFVYKWFVNGPQKIKIGKFPEITVENARKMALAIVNQLNSGINPKAEKNKISKEVNFAEFFEEYMEKYSKAHKKYWKEDLSKYRVHLSYFAKRRVSSITKAEIIKLHCDIAKKSGYYAANRCLELLRSVYNKAIDWGGVLHYQSMH